MSPADRDDPVQGLERELEALVGDRVVPGAAAAIVAGDGVRWRRTVGRRQVEPEPLPVEDETIWDCASLTKPLVTAALVLSRVATGRLALDEPVERLVPELRGTEPSQPRAPTVGELLCHAAGLPAWEPLAALAGPRLADQVRWLAGRREEPGRRAEYGCPAFHVLALLLERESGRAFADLAREELLRDAGAWMPLPASLRARAAATERGNAFERRLAEERFRVHGPPDHRPAWREHLLRGEVHDHGAHVLGGAAGNAGLFATLQGVARLVAPWISPDTWLPEPLARELVSRQSPPGEGSEPRTWGWQIAASPDAPADETVAPGAFAHSGFTGTSVVVDPVRGFAFVLLTNRVHPEWTPRAFNADRRRLHVLATRAWEEVLGRSAAEGGFGNGDAP